MKRIIYLLTHPKDLFVVLMRKTARLWPDETYVKTLYHIRMGGVKPNLQNPQKFTEKLQWLKLHDHNPLYHKLVDKYEVKKYVAERIGEEHVIPCYGVWDNVNDIDFSQLPKQFVLKCTHDSGNFVVCKDKSSLDIKAACKKLSHAMSMSYYWGGREWAYKDVKPRVIAEKYIDSLGKPESTEYKITCIDGVVKVITVCGGIAHAKFEQRSNDNFSREWERQNWYAYYKPTNRDIPRPAQMDDMIAFSEKLSAGIPQVRVDWYVVDGKVYFGEMTFYTWSGFIKYEPEEWNDIMGSWLKLPDMDK